MQILYNIKRSPKSKELFNQQKHLQNALLLNSRTFNNSAELRTKMKVPESTKMKAVLLSAFGGSENLSWGETDLPSELKDNQILIQVVAAGLNRADILQRKGSYPPPAGASELLGLEVSGYVVKSGSKCSKFKIGDSVIALMPGGAHAEYAVAYEGLTMKLPEGLGFAPAAGIPENWITAFQLLHFVPKGFDEYLKGKEGASALVHAGASGVGTALIQLTILMGLKCYVTAGSKEKIDYCLSLGATAGFNYKDNTSWSDQLAVLEPNGVDIIVDCVGASYFEQNMKSIKTDGYYVLYGLLGGAKLDGQHIGWLLGKRLNMFGSTLRTRTVDYKSEIIARFEKEALPEFASGRLQSVVYREIAAENAKEAHDLMESNATMGKIVLVVPQ
ncbi:quinone oxidoreductase PIG3-like isoform X2 [Convolutriloba macropyga]|uniref:quinone oxidoreductase PIG3-like isoform X2 n=1 Tax=Convolutriloba macropyga TaxID=536237 RepID=UPI003F528175